ncbi:UPF0182 family protein [Flaviflexus ciconiae]|uniref:UPF0182 protein EJ997_06755 n=1 Tax=Flaviflexus ciconiae TaxID=2496867 RepID=A0A3S9PXL4_9ACTO|nr:UPF0182 family protein [Flaviflexus ciconiae]
MENPVTTSSFPNRPWSTGGGSGTTSRANSGGGGGGAFIPTVIVLGALLFLFVITANVWTEVLWFDQLEAVRVFWTQWGAQIGVGAVATLILAIVLWLNMKLAYPADGIPEPGAIRNRNLDPYRDGISKYRKLTFYGLPVVLGLIFAAGTGAQWRTVLMFINREPFGMKDPEFGLDVGFFVFTLPMLQLLLSFMVKLLVGSWIVALVMHYLYGGIDPTQKPLYVSKKARIHLSVLGAISSLVAAGWFWLSRYELLIGDNYRYAGASFTDVQASLPAREIMTGICVIIAGIFVWVAVKGVLRVAIAGIAVAVIAQIVVGTAYPALVQQFQVQPNAVELESPYIQRNIDATLAAYGLDNIDQTTYNAETEATAGQLREDSQSTAQIRLLDPNIVSPTFNQLQQNRQYYGFASQLAVDKYEIDGEDRDTVIAVRELNLNGLGDDQRTWVNDHTVYTHGYGVVAAFGNTAQDDGRPAFYEQGIPSVGELGEYEPRVYFGQNSPDYSIVGVPDGADAWELDYPNDDAPNGQVNNTYSGDGGPKIDNIWTKLLFATKFRDQEIFFSDRVNENSQILYDRDPHTRVEKVAPYLTLDSKAYPAVVDMDGDEETAKDLVWIIDGYTTTNQYPYSARESLEDATTTTDPNSQIVGYIPEEVNYIRNSVKAVVNAYDGSVTLYRWDEDDPVLKVWDKIFPGQLTDMNEMSGDLMSHVRYPEDLFKVQRQLLTRYHVKDAASFYSGGDFWNVPPDPTVGEGATTTAQPPYYQTLQMPGTDEATFSLSTSFIPGGNTDRNVLTGFLAVNADAGSEAGVKDEDYGQLRLLELPRDLTVPGPGQVQNSFNANAEVSQELNLLRQGGSTVRSGNLLTLPMGGGLLYVQPVYVQASQGTSYPLLQYVLVAFGDQVGFAPTLDQALDQVFDGDSGAEAGDSNVDAEEREERAEDAKDGATQEPTDDATEQPTEEPTDEPTEDSTGPTQVVGSAQERLDIALRNAQDAMEDSQEAMQSGDWAAYGEAQDRLDEALEQAVEAQQELDGEN